MATRKICVVTGSRADYGLLSPVMEALRSEPAFALQVITTGMHLSPDFGLTVHEIEKDGFFIDGRVDMQLNDDTAAGVTHSLGLGVMGFGKEIDITVNENIVTVRDYGRGIPLGKLKDVASKMNTGAKYDSKVFKKSVGLNGVGIKAVNALSSFFEIRSFRDGLMKSVTFSEGNVLNDAPE